MVLIGFSLQKSLKKVLFFEEIFLFADRNIKIVLKKLFLFLNNANFQLNTRELI